MNIQFVVFLNCICVGILTGFISDLTYLMKKILKDNYIASIAIDFTVFFIGATFVFIIVSNMNDNSFAIFELFGFSIGVMLEKISC